MADSDARLTLRLPPNVAKKVRAAAKRNKVSINTYLTGAAMLAVDKGLAFFHDIPAPALPVPTPDQIKMLTPEQVRAIEGIPPGAGDA